jgi:hypothetical protein
MTLETAPTWIQKYAALAVLQLMPVGAGHFRSEALVLSVEGETHPDA